MTSVLDLPVEILNKICNYCSLTDYLSFITSCQTLYQIYCEYNLPKLQSFPIYLGMIKFTFIGKYHLNNQQILVNSHCERKYTSYNLIVSQDISNIQNFFIDFINNNIRSGKSPILKAKFYYQNITNINRIILENPQNLKMIQYINPRIKENNMELANYQECLFIDDNFLLTHNTNELSLVSDYFYKYLDRIILEIKKEVMGYSVDSNCINRIQADIGKDKLMNMVTIHKYYVGNPCDMCNKVNCFSQLYYTHLYLNLDKHSSIIDIPPSLGNDYGLQFYKSGNIIIKYNKIYHIV